MEENKLKSGSRKLLFPADRLFCLMSCEALLSNHVKKYPANKQPGNPLMHHPLGLAHTLFPDGRSEKDAFFRGKFFFFAHDIHLPFQRA